MHEVYQGFSVSMGEDLRQHFFTILGKTELWISGVNSGVVVNKWRVLKAK